MDRLQNFNNDIQHLRKQVQTALPTDDSFRLEWDFQPRPNDVICGRGKETWNHIGNKRFRALLETCLDRYKAATTKVEKSVMVSEIVATVYHGNGSFVKRDNDGNWYQVADQCAREKTGQCLRDMLPRRQQRTKRSGKTLIAKQDTIDEKGNTNEINAIEYKDSTAESAMVTDCHHKTLENNTSYEPLPINIRTSIRRASGLDDLVPFLLNL